MRCLKYLHILAPLVVFCATLPALNHLDSVALYKISNAGTWAPLINLNHNGFHSWRVDHLTVFFNALYPALLLGERPIIAIAVLFFGTLGLITSLKKRNLSALDQGAPDRPASLRNSLLGLSVVATVIIATGLDPVVLGALAWIPVLTIIVIRINSSESLKFLALLLLGLISIESARSANQLAIFSSVAALWLASLTSASSLRRSSWLTHLILLAPAVFGVFSAPLPDIPHYPQSAHVLPFETSDVAVRPLIGMAYPFEVLDRSAVRELYKSRATILLIGALVSLYGFWGLNSRGDAVKAHYLSSASVILGALTILTTIIPEPWSTVSPIPSLARLLPGGTSYSITSVAIGVGYWLLGLTIVISFSPLKAFLFGALALSLTQLGSGELYEPILRKEQLGLGQQRQSSERLLLSPSTAIFRELAKVGTDLDGWITKTRNSSRLIFTDIQQFNPKMEVFPAPSNEALDNAKKIEGAWRWSARTGKQLGGERLTIALNKPLNILGIELDPGSFASDYPRGLEVRGGGTCNIEDSQLITKYPIWQGPLYVTSRGFPYYGPRNEVRITFDESVELECIHLRQTGKANVDWSVARIRVVLAAESN